MNKRNKERQMIRAIDIKKWGKLLIMLAAAVFLLSACSDKTTQAVKGTEAEEAIEQSRAECWQKAVLDRYTRPSAKWSWECTNSSQPGLSA